MRDVHWTDGSSLFATPFATLHDASSTRGRVTVSHLPPPQARKQAAVHKSLDSVNFFMAFC